MPSRSNKSTNNARPNHRSAPSDPKVAAVFSSYPEPLRTKLLALRQLILDTARTTEGVGPLEETIKWGQVSYLTPETRSGSTVRIDQVKPAAEQYAVYFHCQTNLVETFRELYPDQLRRQPKHSPGHLQGAAEGGAASLRGACADLSSQQAQRRAHAVSQATRTSGLSAPR